MSRRMATILFGCFLASRLHGAPEPPWLEPDYPYRAVFRAPSDAGRFVLITVPLFPPPGDNDAPSGSGATPAAAARGGGVSTNRTPMFLACNLRNEVLPHRVAHMDAGKASVLVQVGEGADNRRGVLYGRWSSSPAGAAAPAPQPELTDPEPIQVDVLRHPGRSEPTSWAKMLYLSSMSSRPLDVFRQNSFGHIKLPENEAQAKREGAPQRIVVLRSFVLCPRSGEYRFALDCRDAGFLLVDGEPTVSWPGIHPAGEWREGSVMSLDAGPHSIEVYNSTRSQDVFVRAGWRGPERPRGPDITAIPQRSLLTSAEAAEKRIERIDRTLHADFAFDLLPSYAFCGKTPVFTPVRFRNMTRNWVPGGGMKCLWNFQESRSRAGPADQETAAFDGARTGEDSAIHVFTTAGLCKAGLEVHDALGFGAICEKTVDCRLVRPRQFVMAAEMISLPPVCYAHERLVPVIRVTGQIPQRTDMEVSWEVEDRSNRRTAGSETIKPDDLPVSISLGRLHASAPALVAWRVNHWGAVLESGSVSFQKPPFTAVPVRAEGDRLYDARGTQLVLLPYRFGGQFAQAPLSSLKAIRQVLLFDDWLTAPVKRMLTYPHAAPRPETGFTDVMKRLLPAGTGLRTASPSEWSESPGTYGPLLKLAQVSAAVRPDTDVVVLSVGVQDMLNLKDPAAFELHAAALSDIVAGSLKRPVAWATPPPCSPDVARVRQYAAAIKKVADARSMPVADLFSAFMSLGEDRGLLIDERTFALTERGRNLAAELIVRALFRREEGNE